MGSFIYYCEHCNAKLNVDNGWLGKTMDCPVCGKKITYPESGDIAEAANPDFDFPDAPTFAANEGSGTASSAGVETADKLSSEGSAETQMSAAEDIKSLQSADDLAKIREISCRKRCKSKYFWGRASCVSVYWLAAAALLIGGYFSWDLYCDYCSAESMIPEKHELAQINANLNRYEKSLSVHFKNAVTILRGSGKISAQGVLDGLSLPENICRDPAPMPLSFSSRKDWAAANKVLEQYKYKNSMIKAEFLRCLGKIVVSSVNNTKINGQNKNQIILQAGEVKKKFYIDEIAKRSQLEALEKNTANIKQLSGSSDLPILKAAVQHLEAVNAFVRQRLFPVDDNTTIVKTVGTAAEKSAEVPNEMLDVQNIMTSLATGWQLDWEIERMEELLKKIPVITDTYNQKSDLNIRHLCRALVYLWSKVLLIAFALLVLGDVLKAFFDKAELMCCMKETNDD